MGKFYTFAVVLLFGCAPQAASTPRATPSASAQNAQSASGNSVTLGNLDGERITLDEVDSDVRAQLVDLENELEQRRLHLNWVGFEEAVNQRLLEREAKKRGVAVDALVKEIGSEAEVSNDEIRAIYDANKESIPVSFEEAQPAIRAQLEQNLGERAVRRFTEELRAGARVDYALPVPDLPRYELDHSKQPTLGNSKAQVTIVEFSDFQCPYCNQAREVLTELKESYGDQVKVVYRDFPLSQHTEARPAAAAAHCALEQDRFWPYHDMLFQNPRALSSKDLRSYAEQLKFDLAAFDSCLSSDRPEQAIAVDEAEAKRLGVEGTPAIFINGVKLIGLLPLPLMRSLIDHELNRSSRS